MLPCCHRHAGESYGGCEGGFCPADDPEAEQHLYTAAASGDVERLQQLLASPALNLSRNIVPDPLGFATVGEVASWAAVKHCQLEAVQVGFTAATTLQVLCIQTHLLLYISAVL